MTGARVFAPGGYRYLPAVFQYSGGVAAEPGFELERARFRQPMPLAEGFAAIERRLAGIARPLAAFCHCELRSPAPFDDEGFRVFNRQYVGTLERWGVFQKEVNPVARSNVCPEVHPPATPSIYAFSYTVPARAGARGTFVVAGCGEAPEGQPNYRDHIVRRGDVSPAGLREKARFVLDEQLRRLQALGFAWADVTATQAYTVHDLHPLLTAEIVPRGATPAGLTWHYCRPPIVDIEYEMDCRGIARELTL